MKRIASASWVYNDNSPFSTDTFTGTESVAYYSGFYTGTGLQFDIVIHT